MVLGSFSLVRQRNISVRYGRKQLLDPIVLEHAASNAVHERAWLAHAFGAASEVAFMLLVRSRLRPDFHNSVAQALVPRHRLHRIRFSFGPDPPSDATLDTQKRRRSRVGTVCRNED